MTTTTTEVGDGFRDRPKRQASRATLTLGADLSVLADAADRRERLAGLRRVIEEGSSLSAESHRSESQVWEASELSDAERG